MSTRPDLPGSVLDVIIGHKIDQIEFTEDLLVFWSGRDTFAFTVYGDCCSDSYFYDFHGVRNLLESGPIIGTATIHLAPESLFPRYQDEVACYGYKLVAEHPTWGEITAVLSFRNDSKGYYGGEMQYIGKRDTDQPIQFITDDVLETDSR